jgi:hypothetical protein
MGAATRSLRRGSPSPKLPVLTPLEVQEARFPAIFNGWLNDNSISDRLGRIAYVAFDIDLEGTGSAGVIQTAYKYNGVDRLISVDYLVPDVLTSLKGSVRQVAHIGFDWPLAW